MGRIAAQQYKYKIQVLDNKRFREIEEIWIPAPYKICLNNQGYAFFSENPRSNNTLLDPNTPQVIPETFPIPEMIAEEAKTLAQKTQDLDNIHEKLFDDGFIRSLLSAKPSSVHKYQLNDGFVNAMRYIKNDVTSVTKPSRICPPIIEIVIPSKNIAFNNKGYAYTIDPQEPEQNSVSDNEIESDENYIAMKAEFEAMATSFWNETEKLELPSIFVSSLENYLALKAELEETRTSFFNMVKSFNLFTSLTVGNFVVKALKI